MNMTYLTKYSLRTVIVTAVAGLLAGLALLSVSPSRSEAAVYPCVPNEFCLYFNEDGNGGRYSYEFSDANLNNDKYEGGDTGETVGNTARYVWNNGKRGPKDDVVIFSQPGYKGADACIRLQIEGVLPRNWWNNIESFRWATNAECEKAGDIPVGEF
jgi:hypothetical protein